jgi:elongator complex protein 3
MRKATRTISGVTPVAVMAKPFPCPGDCVYCPASEGAPKSYTLESPAVLRALRCEFDPARQVVLRLQTLLDMGHPVQKVELIVMGGTFLAYPVDYQFAFIKACFDALNGVESDDLESAQALNETAEHRCVGLCIETRPDWCGPEEVSRMLEFGVTRVELGVQTIDDEIHQLTHRGHGVTEIVSATRLLREKGFKVYYHWMPGLPGSSPEHDIVMTRVLFDDSRFRPDGLKLYPTVVVSGSRLETWYDEGRYVPGTTLEMRDLLIEIKKLVPPYVRIARLMRDIPRKFIRAGCDDLALRGTIRKHMAEVGASCQCIRCREYGHRVRDGWKPGTPSLVRRDYDADPCHESLLTFEDNEGTLFALLRLSILGTLYREEDGNVVATVRELHVFGPEVDIGEYQEGAVQHRGLGAILLQEAERIAAAEYGATSLRVLSGVGVRGYYRELGYNRRGPYMVKSLEVAAA